MIYSLYMKVNFQKPISLHHELKSAVDAYFIEQKLSKKGNFQLKLKAVILMSLFVVLYSLLVFVVMPWWLSILLCVAFGVVLALIGFNIMHDACHGSFSTNDKVNYTLGLTMNLLGSNAFIWKKKHNDTHHIYTNVDGMDDDIVKVPIFRWCETQERKSFHRFQHLYAFPLYMVTPILWVFVLDYIKYFNKRIVGRPFEIDTKERAIFWLSKVFYVIFYVAVPIYFLGFAKFIIGYLIYNAVFGLVLSLVFQMAHVVENTHFENSTVANPNIANDWATHQLITTTNFATDNTFLTWCLGGLNFQVEHHLFSKISHVHYPALQKIVEQVCAKNNVPYLNYATISDAFFSHYRFVRAMGRG